MSDKSAVQWSRRGFLGATLAATTGVHAAPTSRRLNVACIGLGGQMQGHLKEITINLKQNLAAVCDVDETRIARSAKTLPHALAGARVYRDYRKLLADEKSLDAVIIATPDHWHYSIATAALRAGKHVYCEKPLTHSIGDARRLRELSRRGGLVTQTGNHGSASANFRRCIELIEAGVFGQIREVHVWHPVHGWPSGVNRPDGEDPIPEGFDWDFWLGPAQERPYKKGIYHPFKWRGWYAFGGGSLADFCCHAFNLPVRALHLQYPTSIQVEGVNLDKDSFPTTCTVGYRFPRRGRLDPVSLQFYTGGAMPPPHVTRDLKQSLETVPAQGCLLIGDHGTVSAGLWNTDGHMKLREDKSFSSVNDHPVARVVPKSLPRTQGHMREWVDACMGGPPTFSNFEVGGHITEIGLAGVLALRIGHDIDWDGQRMHVYDSPEADDWVSPEPRTGWRL